MDFERDDQPFLRPFLATAGRTRSEVEGLRLETLVEATTLPSHKLRFEAAQIYALCSRPIGVAELSAQMQAPIGTTKVLVGDLIISGNLHMYESLDGGEHDTEELVARLINGVRKL